MIFQHFHTLVQRLFKALLFETDDTHYLLPVFLKLRIGVTHKLNQQRDSFAEEGNIQFQEPPVSDGTAQDTPQDVTSSLVGGHDAVGNQKGNAAQMFRQDA